MRITDEKALGWNGIDPYYYPVVRMECLSCGEVEKAYAIRDSLRADAVAKFTEQHKGCGAEGK